MKKSYTLLIVWMIVFCVAEVGLCFLPFGEDLLMRLTLNGCSIGIAVLTLIIYLTGYVYWYNGVKFQDAVAAGPARRKRYALRHLLRFGIFAAAYLLFSVVMQILHVNQWVDFTVFFVGILVIAFSTIKIRL